MNFTDSTHPNFAGDEEARQVIASFEHYGAYSMRRVNKSEAYLNAFAPEHQEMLQKYRNHLKRIRECIDANHQIVCKMITNINQLFQNGTTMIPKQEVQVTKIRQQNLNCSLKVQITLKQFARDWSSEGEEERRQCYQPIIDEILDFYKPSEIDVSNIKVLVPGAGLGRLAYEIAYQGYSCEGNEYSLFMLIASNFVINKCEIENQYTLYPWMHQFVNNVTRNDQIAPITFPDVSPVEAPPKGEFTMVAGDFLQVYTQADYWDCVATCFFIDCAHNVIEFIETIYRILKPGAIWVNLGPLLYHYSDDSDELSIEPTYEDLISIIEKVGFEIMKSKTGIRTKYAQNPRSMQQSEYLSVFSLCRKPLVQRNLDYNEADQ